jgi:invasion protein IalB
MKAELMKSLTLAALVAFAAPAIAQDTTTTDTTTDTTAEQPVAESDLSMGVPAQEELQPGQAYVDEVIDDWERRCLHNPDGEDPCHIYQLVLDAEGVPMADITIVRLPAGQQAAAGATVIAPLEVLLTQQLTLGVDSAAAKRYPFRFCTQVGCVAQIGFTGGEIEAFRKGNVAKMIIVPAIAPDQNVELNVSLKGFTKAFESLPVPEAPAN